jgi:glycosyltransferase involved in cell wall biosynthesis
MRKSSRIVVDFDDVLHLLPEGRCKGWWRRMFWNFVKKPDRIAYLVRKSAKVIVGNPNLAKYSHQYQSPQNVTIIPTTVDMDFYRPVIRQRRESVCVGWTGSRTAIEHLRLKENVLVRLKRTHGVEIKIVGSRRYSIPGCHILAQDWKAKTEVEDLEGMDIGIMPLPDTELARGKCGCKILIYMAMGMPVVCSPVGVNRDIVQDGVNGFLATSDEEWYEKLRMLVEDSSLRERLGKAAREMVEERYSKKCVAPLYERVLSEVAQGSGVR